MPLEINEIGIQMRVREEGGSARRQPSQAQAGECRDLEREEIVDDCVRRVLKILRTLDTR